MIDWTPGQTLADVERLVILKAFKFFQGNKTRTAGALDIAIRTLDSKLEQYGVKASPHGVVSYELPPESRLHMESAVAVAQKQSVSVCEREEIQEVLRDEDAPSSPERKHHKGKR